MAKVSQTAFCRELATQYSDCAKCKLHDEWASFAPGFGCVDSPDVVFIGEAPGETEVKQGEPFVGKAGQFLRMVLKDQGIDESRCYFTNACLCRPPGNRKPKKSEINACNERLMEELAALRPKLIVTLGGVPSTLLKFRKGIAKTHGVVKFLKLDGKHKIPVLPTYHPSGVLRSAEYFTDFQDELELAKKYLDGEPIQIKPPYKNYIVVDTQEKYETFLVELSGCNRASCDIETNTERYTTGDILCIGFSWKRECAWTVDWPGLIANNLDNLRALDKALVNVRLSFQNGLYDIPFLLHAGMTNVNYHFDTMLAHFILDERQGTHGLERLAVKYYQAPDYKTQFRTKIGVAGFVEDVEFKKKITECDKHDLYMYNCADCDYTFRLTQDLRRKLKETGQLHILRDIEIPAAKLFTELYMEGMLVDRVYWNKMAKAWYKEMNKLEEEMKAMAILDDVEDLRVTSPKNLAKYLYDVLELAPFGGRKMFKERKIPEDIISKCINEVKDDPEAREYWTSKRTQMSEGLKGMGGQSKGMQPRSTTTYMLYWLRQQHKFPTLLIKWRTLKKRYSLYREGLNKHVWQDGRIHPTYNMTATRTGRKSTEKPAIHNLPRGDEIYNIWIADPGWLIIHADYKTAEMRMMAHYSGDKDLEHILDTEDIHSRVAREIFGITMKKWNKLDKTTQKNMRIAAKMITFGIPYGRSAQGLAPQLGISSEQAQRYINRIFELMPGLHKWILKQRKEGTTKQIVYSAFGRRRHFPLITGKWHRREVERQAGNMPIQSAINDLTLIAHRRSVDGLRAAGIPCKVWPHIHDSLNVSVPIPLVNFAVKIIAKAMEENIPFETKMNFPAEIETGTRWGDMTTVYEGIKYDE